MVGQRVTVELKNDMEIEGRLESVDQFLNVKLSEINVIDEEKYPHLVRNNGISWILNITNAFYCIARCKELLLERLSYQVRPGSPFNGRH